MCIVRNTRQWLSVHQPDPPGLIHDDPRLLPPWRGSSLFYRQFPLSFPVTHIPGTVHSQRFDDWPNACAHVSVDAVSAASPVVLPVVLIVVEDMNLSAGADRVVAAVGARAVRTEAPSRTTWLAAAAVILDEAGARRCAQAGMPRRDGVLLIGPEDPSVAIWTTAIDIGAQYVCALPHQEADMVRHLAETTERGETGPSRGRVIAVTGGAGGSGASVFAAALGRCADVSLLVDLDPCGGGIELLLGGEAAPGLRWPDLTPQSGRLSWTALREVLPRQDGMSFLSGTRSFHDLDPGAVGAVVDAGRRGGATVVCDIARQPAPVGVCALHSADLVVVVSSCDVRAIAATAAVTPVIRTLNPNIGLVVRGPAPGGLRAAEVAGAVAVPLLAAMRPEPMLAARLERGGLRLRQRSPLAQAARSVLGLLERNAEGRPS